MSFLQGLSGVWYLAGLFFIAFISDIIVTLYYRAIHLRLVSQVVILSGMINILSLIVVAWVITAKDGWPLVFDTAGVMAGTFVGMNIRMKK